jgi:UDP-glucose 4-epimerase
MDSTVLVTGNSKLVAHYLLDSLCELGYRVVGSTDGRGRPSRQTEAALGGLFDLTRLVHVLRENGVHRIVHAADVSDPRRSIEMPVATVVANVEGVLHLLEAARLADVRGRIVLLSSTAVYGDNEGPLDEHSALRPSTPHAVSKVTTEQLGKVYADLYGLDVVVLRIGEEYGPELAPPAVVAALMSAAAQGEPFRLFAGADQTFHLTHGEDIARAVIATLTVPGARRRVYNVTGGERHALSHIAALVCDRFPGSQIDIGPGHLPELDRQGRVAIRAAAEDLGYRPLWGLARGLDDYAEWLLAQAEAA